MAQRSWNLVYGSTALFALAALIPAALLPAATTGDNRTQSVRTNVLASMRASRNLAALFIPYSILWAAITPFFVYAQKIFFQKGLEFSSIGLVLAFTEVTAAFLTARLLSRSGPLGQRKVLTFLGILIVCLASQVTASLIISLITFFLAQLIMFMLHNNAENQYQHAIKDDHLRASILSTITLFDSCMIGLGYLVYGFALKYLNVTTVAALSCVIPAASFCALLLQGLTSFKKRDAYVSPNS